jgi:predicted nucleotidyltransferase component of viral defense system
MYTLHNDTEAFQSLITQISSEQSILPEIIEKDYFVTLILQEIADKQKSYEVFFKGGTALYKALKSINRFSEDIDLTFNDRSFDSKTAKKTALKRVTSEYTSIAIKPEDDESVSGSGSRTSIYIYSTLFAIDTFRDDKLNRIGKLKVETTSFTTSSPVSTYEIEPILYTYANDEYKQILQDSYNVNPFMIKCISIERIFIDKLFAIEDYYLGSQTNRLIEMSKHMYDVYHLYSLSEIKQFIQSSDKVKEVVEIKEDEQLRRKEAKTQGKAINQFEYFNKIADVEIKDSFESMQRIYIFKNEFKVDFADVLLSFNSIFTQV